jgi:phosphoribosylformimino-5-aminoimidazole carboxamide ribotide isomerase
MPLIPVIDIKKGLAVHARLGLREQYQPLNTALCPSSDITQVINCFLTVYDFKIIYLADLDAITATGNNQELIKKIVLIYPKITFWVDSGYQQQPSLLASFNNYQTVLGSESYSDNVLNHLKSFEKNFILSLDFSAQGKPLGSKKLFNQQDLWTPQIILMMLARVGSGQGVDCDKLIYYQQLNPKIEFIASGGIRSIDDVFALKKIGIKKVLCATALHNKTISSTELQKL